MNELKKVEKRCQSIFLKKNEVSTENDTSLFI